MVPHRAPRAVLLCDDNPHARLVMARMLEALGLSVTAVASGREAIAMAEARGFDLALVDIEMPEMDGHSTARALEALVPLLIAITGHDSATVNDDAFHAVLTKPLSATAMIALLKQSFRSGEE